MTIPIFLPWVERHETPQGTATVYVTEDNDCPRYIGVIDWRGAPTILHELVAWAPDLGAVRDETWKRLTHGPHRP